MRRVPSQSCAASLFDIHSIKQSWKDMETGHKWSWKVLENHFQCSLCTLLISTVVPLHCSWMTVLSVFFKVRRLRFDLCLFSCLSVCQSTRLFKTLWVDFYRGGFRHVQHVRLNRGPQKNGAPTWGPKKISATCQHTEVARKSLK